MVDRSLELHCGAIWRVKNMASGGVFGHTFFLFWGGGCLAIEEHAQLSMCPVVFRAKLGWNSHEFAFKVAKCSGRRPHVHSDIEMPQSYRGFGFHFLRGHCILH